MSELMSAPSTDLAVTRRKVRVTDMTPITGIHPYAEKFPMLPEPGFQLVGTSGDPACLVMIDHSDEHPGYFDLNVSTAAGQQITMRPTTSRDLIALCVQRETCGAELKWDIRPRPAQVAPHSRNVVYFVADEDGYVKIGTASCVSARMSTLQTASRQELTLLATIPGTSKDEHALHRRFSHAHVRGEWFRPTASLRSYIAALDDEDA